MGAFVAGSTAVMMPSWKVTSAVVSGLPDPSTRRAFLMTVFLWFSALLTFVSVVVIGKWESPGVAVVAVPPGLSDKFRQLGEMMCTQTPCVYGCGGIPSGGE